MKKWTILLLALLCSTAGAAAQDFSVVNPRCEYRDEPLGINTLTPRFSWQISARDRGFLQSAYELIVGDDRAAVAAGRGNLWRVKTKGAESLHIPYAGKALESGKEYYWSVRVWNAAGEVSPWMPVNRFSTGLMSPDAWSGARWIAMEVQPDSLRLVPGEEYNKLTIGDRITAPNRLPQFRREIDVRKPVKRAMAYVSGLGQFEFFINGDKVGDNFLDPAWSDYDKIVCYVPFDVTDRLQQGANVLGVMLGNGMYNVPRERYYKLLMTYGYPMMICKVDVEYADGTHDVIVSDGSWRTTTSPVTYSSIFGGEDYDATLERTGWMTPGYDDSSWQEVLFTSQRGELIAPKALPVKVMEEFPVFKIRKTKYGKWLYDMGQNFSGVACLTVKGKRGQAVRMNTCELFDPAVDSIQIHGGYRGETRYTYTLRGDAEPESWAPQFTYHGFRYVLIDGAVPAGEPNPEGLPEIVDVRGLHIRNSTPESGTFVSSNDLLNKTQRLIGWGIKSNMVSYLTDCPHREKLPWLEQLHLMFGSLQYTFDMFSLYEKMLDDMAMAQLPNGLVPDIAPEYALFREAFRDSPEWGSAFVLVPLYLYEYYGDGTMLRKHYEAMGRYVDYLTSKADDHILKHGLGDWFDIGPKMPGRAQLSSLAATATPIYYMDALAMVKGAELLGKKKDAERWQKLADAIRTSYNEKFFHKEGCYYDRNSQTANSIALCAGLVDPEYRQGVLDNVVKDIRSRNNGLTGGDVGYTYILRALEAGGRSDVIFDMNSRYDVYGYGYMLAQGATALPESWQVVPIKSHNHFMLGHLMQWLYTHVGGIRRDTGALAYKRSVIRPEAVGDLTMARVSFESPYGQIRSEWSKGADGSFELLAEVPANTTSTVWLPAAEDAAVFESNLPVEKVAGIEYLGYKEGCKVYAVGSGTYRFDVRPQR